MLPSGNVFSISLVLFWCVQMNHVVVANSSITLGFDMSRSTKSRNVENATEKEDIKESNTEKKKEEEYRCSDVKLDQNNRVCKQRRKES